MKLRRWLQPYDNEMAELGLWLDFWRDDLSPSWTLSLKVGLIIVSFGISLNRYVADPAKPSLLAGFADQHSEGQE